MSEAHWHVKYEGTTYGPYTEQELLRFVMEGRINSETEVNHPRVTQGLWTKAKMVRLLVGRFAPPAPPQEVSAPPVTPQEERSSTPSHQSSYRTARSPIPRKYQSGWTYALCIAFEWTAIIWMGIFVWSALPFGGAGTYFILETGNGLAHLMDRPESSLNLKALALTWAFFKHSQYALYLLATAQLLRMVERIRYQ